MSLEDRVHGTKPYCCVNVIKTDDGSVYMRDYKKKNYTIYTNTERVMYSRRRAWNEFYSSINYGISSFFFFTILTLHKSKVAKIPYYADASTDNCLIMPKCCHR